MSYDASIQKEIRKYAAEYINREASRLSLITITQCELSHDKKYATLFISIMPDSAAEIGIQFLKRHQDDVRDYVKKHAKIHNLPWLRFTLDEPNKIE